MQKLICSRALTKTVICENALFFITGDDKRNFNKVSESPSYSIHKVTVKK